jgi:DNA ligase-1
VYTTDIGNVDTDKGIGLRFPRLLKVREDKKPNEATTNTQIYDIYK